MGKNRYLKLSLYESGEEGLFNHRSQQWYWLWHRQGLALRMELSGTPIQISCIEPGLVMTELHQSWEVHPRESMGIQKPLSVEDIVETVRFIMNQPDHVRIPRLMILPGDHNI
jgi:NADP-dependent 3-hydroxy acid dehydrogenase YdfG